MSKRSREEEEVPIPRKKKSKTKSIAARPTEIAKIHTARQIGPLLEFSPYDSTRQRQGIKTFQLLLDTIVHPNGEPDVEAQAILDAFVQSEAFRSPGDTPRQCLPGLMQAWKQAAFNNDDALLTEIPALLALLLRVVSQMIDLRRLGISLCRTLLHPQQAKLIARGLCSAPNRERLIGPCLRLVFEIVSFDGGSLTKLVISNRDLMLKSLGRNLGLSRPLTGDTAKDKRKPSLRTHAARIFIQCLALANDSSKVELLSMPNLTAAIVKDFTYDPADLLLSMIACLKDHLVLNKGTALDTKREFFSTWMLKRLHSLYSYTENGSKDNTSSNAVQLAVHELLTLICCSKKPGILLDGQTEPVCQNQAITSDRNHSFSGGKSRFGLDKAPKNTFVVTFGGWLQPWSEPQDAKLVFGMFKASWWTVHDYFVAHDKTFTLDGEIDQTWMRKSAFLHMVVQLEPPDLKLYVDQYETPILATYLIEIMLPRPASKEILATLLRKESDIARIFAIQLLCAALSKLNNLCQKLKDVGTPQSERLAIQLRIQYIQRVPPITTIARRFFATPNDDIEERVAITRLLSLCFTCLPNLALREKIDVSGILETRMQEYLQSDVKGEKHPHHSQELESLLTIAKCVPTTKWWQKRGNAELSCLTRLIRLGASTVSPELARTIATVLRQLIADFHLLPGFDVQSAIDVFLLSIRSLRDSPEQMDVLIFIDKTISSYIPKSTYYWDEWAQIVGYLTPKEAHNLGQTRVPFIMAIFEQWQRLAKSETAPNSQVATARWINLFISQIAVCVQVEGMTEAVKRFFHACAARTQFEEFLVAPREAHLTTLSLPASSSDEEKGHPESQEDVHDSNQIQAPASTSDGDMKLASLTDPVDERSALLRWAQVETEQAIDQGDVGNLYLCLASGKLAIRQQAFINIASFGQRLDQSSHSEKVAITLLTKELLFTAEPLIVDNPMPAFLIAFASGALEVLANPLHFLYPKVNEFLQQGPKWADSTVPMFHKIMLYGPTEDEGYYQEVQWLLERLIKGLRTSKDLYVYISTGMFERLLPLFHLAQRLQPYIIELLWVAVNVEDGPTTLVTRCGMMTWIKAMAWMEGVTDQRFARIQNCLVEAMKKERVVQWSGENRQHTTVE
ncbi:MAG: hypothetical protein M1814_001561 [Vezdaea aestivalis]|nr:MAG: hypothetical protein M1814_001561 [Vezdaea aestivalis]